jgi:FkbM family methyltransferase
VPDTPANKDPFHYIVFRDFKNSYIPQILEETYIKKVYQQFVTGRRDMVIVDIGANIGLTSYYFKDFAKQVYAVEPAKDHLEVIQRMIELNGITNIHPLPYAVSNENGTTRFYHNQNTTMYSMEDTVNNKDDYEEVETITMDKLMELVDIDHIDLLKADPEGSESKIFTSEGFKKVASKIKVIVGEWHSWDSQSKEAFANTLKDLGYQFHWNNNTDAATYSAVRL